MALNNLGWLYLHQGRHTESEQSFKRSLAMDEKALDPAHPRVASDLGNLALLYREQGKRDKAENLLVRAVAILDKTMPDSLELAINSANLADLYSADGRLDDAEALFKRSLVILESAVGPVHPFVAQGLSGYAFLLRKSGRIAEAEGLERRVKTIRAMASKR